MAVANCTDWNACVEDAFTSRNYWNITPLRMPTLYSANMCCTCPVIMSICQHNTNMVLLLKDWKLGTLSFPDIKLYFMRLFRSFFVVIPGLDRILVFLCSGRTSDPLWSSVHGRPCPFIDFDFRFVDIHIRFLAVYDCLMLRHKNRSSICFKWHSLK